jgi:hypothetical protein
MPGRTPDEVVNCILIRLALDEPVPAIANAVGIGKKTIYKIQLNMDLWGVPYPPSTVKLGRPRTLLPYQEMVIYNVNSVELQLMLL